MPDAYSTAVLADSPIAYWRVGEPSGTSAADEVGGHTGTYTAGVTLAQTGAIPSSSDTAMRLTTGAITVPDVSDIRFTNHAMSAEAWVEPDDATTASQQFIGFFDIGGSNEGWAVALGAITTQKISFFSTLWVTSTGSVPTDGLWHHIVVTVNADASVVTFYIDGASAGTGSAGGILAYTGQKRIGQGSWGGQQFVGGLDEIALYDTELSAARVLAHYSAATLVVPAPAIAAIVSVRAA